MKQIGCLIYGNQLNYLDHLAPLCYFFNIPLVTNIEEIAIIAKKYYPKIPVHFVDGLNIHPYVVKNFDTIISCVTQKLFDSNFKFHQDLLGKKVQIVWCPHGNSDKGKTCFFFESLKNEKAVIVYGKKMISLLNEKKILHSIKHVLEIGNYRLEYYKKFKNFFDQRAKNEILKKLPSGKTTILYAPTWKDSENSSSFEFFVKPILKMVTSKYNLIVKLHPNLLQTSFTQIEILKAGHNKKNILFLDNFPLIYPLLNVTDIYLGDFSSIGYDFLYFQKPMFFLQPKNKKLKSDLFGCGKLLSKTNIFKTIDKKISNGFFKDKMTSLYKNAFTQKIDLEKIKNKIFNF